MPDSIPLKVQLLSFDSKPTAEVPGASPSSIKVQRIDRGYSTAGITVNRVDGVSLIWRQSMPKAAASSAQPTAPLTCDMTF